jgi:hypothetical protein
MLVISPFVVIDGALSQEEVQDKPIDAAIKLLGAARADGARQLIDRWRVVAGFRIWKDTSGKFSAEARFVDNSDDAVQLQRKDDRRVVEVPISSLDFSGRERVAEIKKLRMAIFNAVDEARAEQTKKQIETALQEAAR